jgi:hypothetical protein
MMTRTTFVRTPLSKEVMKREEKDGGRKAEERKGTGHLVSRTVVLVFLTIRIFCFSW